MASDQAPLSPQDAATAIVAALNARAAVASGLAMLAGVVDLADESLDVATLLAQSRSAHLEYRRHCATPQSPGDPLAAKAALAEAARLRAQAELADPNHEQAAWLAEDGTPYEHDSLIAWYAAQLTQ